LGSQTELGRKLSELERRIEGHDTAIRSLFGAIRQLMAPPAGPPKPEIGFHVKEDSVPYRIRLVVADSGGMRPDALVKTLPTVCSLIPGTFEYLSYSDNGPDTTFSQENGYKDYMGSHAVSKRKVTRAIIWRRKICCP
jgi:hypothetical protein